MVILVRYINIKFNESWVQVTLGIPFSYVF